MKKTVLFLGLLFIGCCFSTVASAEISVPSGWHKNGNNPDSFSIGRATESVNGQMRNMVSVQSEAADKNDFGGLVQMIRAGKYLGSRVEFSAYIKLENVGERAELWLRVDDGSKEMAFHNTSAKPSNGQSSWTKYKVAIDVPQKCSTIHFGVDLWGKGKVVFGDLAFKTIDNKTPLANVYVPAAQSRKFVVNPAPVNLKLATAAKNANAIPQGWEVGTKLTQYNVSADSGTVLLKYDGNDNSGLVFKQRIAAAKYRGSRVEFSGWLKSENVANSSILWIRADSDTEPVAINNMDKRPIHGTTAWTKYDVTLDIPDNCTKIIFGSALYGKGTVWLKDLGFKVLGKAKQPASVLNILPQHDSPVNLELN